MGIEILIAAAVIGVMAGQLAGVLFGVVTAGLAAGAMFLLGGAKKQSGAPNFGTSGSLASSPTYGRFGALQNTISDKIPVPVQFGRVNVAGNVIWQSEPGTKVTQVIVMGQGQLEDLEEIRLNDKDWRSFTGVKVSVRDGAKNQLQDGLVTIADPDVEGLDLRGFAYLAVALKAGPDLSGNPTVTAVSRGVKCSIYNEAYFTERHSWHSGDAVKPVNSTAVQANDGYFQNISAPDNVRLSDVEFGLSWREGDQNDEDNADWLRSDSAYVQLYRSNGSIPTGTVIVESSRVLLSSVTEKNKGNNGVGYNVKRFIFPPNTNLTSGDKYAFLVRTTYAKSAQKNCVHILGDFSSPSYAPFNGGYLNSGTFTAISGDLCFRANMFKSNSNGWNNGPVWTRNPSAILREIMLNNIWGVGRPSGDLIDSMFGTSYDYCNQMVGDTNGGWEPRFEIDFNLDSTRPALDTLDDLAQSCMGFFIRQGNKVGFMIMKSGDSVKSFGDGSPLDVNNYDNIKEGSFKWGLGSLDDLPNRMIVRYIEPAEKWNESTVEVNDRIDQEARNLVVPDEQFFPSITRRTQASRLAKYKQISKKYANVDASWAGFLDSSEVEIGDVVSLWHKAGLYEGKKFRIKSKENKANGEIDYVGMEYYDSLFDDRDGIRAPQRIIPTGPNIFQPVQDVSGLTVTEVAVAQGTFGQNGDGRIVSNISISWTPATDDQLIRMRSYRISYSVDGGSTYTDAGYAQPADSSAVIVDVKVGLTYTIKVTTVSIENSESTGSTASLLIEGKQEPPSDVENFSVSILGSELIFTWDQISDVDLQGYEIRVGETWETSAVVDTFLVGTIYRSSSVLTGPRTYHIKAINYSNIYSTNATSDTINVTSVPDSNIVLTYKEWQRIQVHMGHRDLGSINSSGDFIMTNEFNSQYFRRALTLKTERTWSDVDALAMTCDQIEANASTQQFDQPLYGGEDVYYETLPIDLGQGLRLIGDLILDYRTASEAGGTIFTVDYSTSDDNITYSSWTSFAGATLVTRFIKFRLKLRTTEINTYIRVLDFNAIFDIPDIIDQGSNVAIGVGGTTITFSVLFAFTPKSIVATTVESSTTKVPIISSITRTSFVVTLRDKTDASVIGNINWIAKGAGGLQS